MKPTTSCWAAAKPPSCSCMSDSLLTLLPPSPPSSVLPQTQRGGSAAWWRMGQVKGGRGHEGGGCDGSPHRGFSFKGLHSRKVFQTSGWEDDKERLEFQWFEIKKKKIHIWTNQNPQTWPVKASSVYDHTRGHVDINMNKKIRNPTHNLPFKDLHLHGCNTKLSIMYSVAQSHHAIHIVTPTTCWNPFLLLAQYNFNFSQKTSNGQNFSLQTKW